MLDGCSAAPGSKNQPPMPNRPSSAKASAAATDTGPGFSTSGMGSEHASRRLKKRATANSSWLNLMIFGSGSPNFTQTRPCFSGGDNTSLADRTPEPANSNTRQPDCASQCLQARTARWQPAGKKGAPIAIPTQECPTKSPRLSQNLHKINSTRSKGLKPDTFPRLRSSAQPLRSPAQCAEVSCTPCATA